MAEKTALPGNTAIFDVLLDSVVPRLNCRILEDFKKGNHFYVLSTKLTFWLYIELTSMVVSG